MRNQPFLETITLTRTCAWGIVILLPFILFLFACNTSTKKLNFIYGKELYSGRDHLYSGVVLKIYRDSTFEYSRGGPQTYYSNGRWFINKGKRGLKLVSNHPAPMVNGLAIDSAYVTLDGSVLIIINKTKVRFQDRILYIQK